MLMTFSKNKELKNNLITDNYGKTLAMYFIQYLHQLPPKKLLHDKNIKSKCGKTMKDYWIQYVNKKIPSSINTIDKIKVSKLCSHFDKYENLVTKDHISGLCCKDCANTISDIKTSEKIYGSEICAICRESFESVESITLFTDCKHIYCSECVKDMEFCPLRCRKITSSLEAEEKSIEEIFSEQYNENLNLELQEFRPLVLEFMFG
jgi:hypothetical protein